MLSNLLKELNPETIKNTVCIGDHNIFHPVSEDEIKKAEKILGCSFPNQLREFYKNIGYGSLTTPYNPPENYTFYGANDILPPFIIANFSKGILEWDNQHSWMAESTYEDLEPGDLPFFEIGDSSSFLIMKLYSDNPSAVWSGNIKIEDSFEKFIWRLYYESPSYYGDLM